MFKRLSIWIAVLVVAALAVLLVLPTSRSVVLGLAARENFHQNRPTSYWVAQLKASEPNKRREAAFLLGQVGAETKEVVPALCSALQDEVPEVRFNAALALYKIGPEARMAVPALTAALKDDVALVRMDATLALFRLGPEAAPAVPSLIEAMQLPGNRTRIPMFARSIREQMAATLGRIGPNAQEAVPALCVALKDDEAQMRWSAALALALIDKDAFEKAAPDMAAELTARSANN